MKKQSIMRMFGMWDMAAVTDEFAAISLESKDHRISVNFETTGRMGFIMNKIFVELINSSFRRLLASMQEKLNWI